MIKVITRENCPNCIEAKKLLNDRNVSFQEVMIERDITRDEVLATYPGRKQLPIIDVQDDSNIDWGSLAAIKPFVWRN